MNKKKIVIYFTHKESLGHTMRVLTIIKALKAKFGNNADITIFHAGKQQDFFTPPENTTWIDLPYPYHSKLDFKRSRQFSFTTPIYAKLRSELMLKRLKKIKPDIFMTEFFPFGREECRFELLPILGYLTRSGTKIYASIGYPYIVRTNINILLSHCDYYEKFFIHTPERLEYEFLSKDITSPVYKAMHERTFKHIDEKIRYTGYIMPFNSSSIKDPQTIRDSFKTQGRKLVVVTRGGGPRCPRVVVGSILSAKFLPKDKFVFIIAAGPSTSDREMSLFKKLQRSIKNNKIYIFKYLPDLPSYLNACDVSVGMAGYNTSVPLLYFRKPSIFIPAKEDPETALGYCSEQISRAKLMNKYLGSFILDYHEFEPQGLAKKILQTLNNSLTPFASRIKNGWFNGADNTADLIMHE
ncbi:MAG: hypothetical protein AUJ74_00320 [Candidatus Omnitrophica bacterium CG1_02_44_16]|nr:MAG: hypothetical protein AUJ74_00320 [Candidatus Omnitrophica bacterium CG1_02_44_16]PIY83066.1 MAG: hypothetical protein COY78_03760 [Candidatus Omnitrophica bacterium CG_4_10_14_0_8_um_filter_44_12]PIZ83393.1 MAG: hypothetical protein COX96_08180 [Candidatus Omnitrophica bacterium CG_4_10_14_0_2_um_filter_44_9]